MRTTFDIPDAAWAALARVADSRGVHVNDLITDAVMALIPRGISIRNRIPAMVRSGLPDAVISERLNVPKGYVGKIRREHGLKPNRFNRAEWDEEFQRGRVSGPSFVGKKTA